MVPVITTSATSIFTVSHLSKLCLGQLHIVIKIEQGLNILLQHSRGRIDGLFGLTSLLQKGISLNSLSTWKEEKLGLTLVHSL